jgi:hypothetical protein
MPKLSDADEQEFQSWYQTTSKDLGLHPNPDAKEHYYDYRGYWNALRNREVLPPQYQPEHRQIRFPDEYKLPGHPEPAHGVYDHSIDRQLNEEE